MARKPEDTLRTVVRLLSESLAEMGDEDLFDPAKTADGEPAADAEHLRKRLLERIEGNRRPDARSSAGAKRNRSRLSRRTWLAIAAVLVVCLVPIVGRHHPHEVDLLFLLESGAHPAREEPVDAADVLALSVRIVSATDSGRALFQTSVSLASGMGLMTVRCADSSVVIVLGEHNDVEYAGVGRVASGLSIVEIGPPGSRPYGDYLQVTSVLADPAVGPHLVCSLPFEVQRVLAENRDDATRSRLAGDAGAVFFDDIAVYDGARLLWSEDFEAFPVGSYPAAPMDSIFPNPRIPMDPGGDWPRGIVTTARARDGARSFLSLSVPKRARIDGLAVTRDQIVSDTLRYQAGVYLNSTDARGAFLSLKQDAPEPGRWFDKAGLRFANGTIDAVPSGKQLGHYRAGQWYRVEVVVRLRDRTMSVLLDGHEIDGNVVAVVGDQIARENQTWSPARVWEGFDHFGFGGLFFTPLEERDDRPLPIEIQGDGWVTYRLDGARPGWQPTSLVMNVGDSVSVRASGDVFNALPGPSRTDPDGCHLEAVDPCAMRTRPDAHSHAPASLAWSCALVARVGDGDGFFVGTNATVVADRRGVLELAFNDPEYVGDNRGHFLVTITRSD